MILFAHAEIELGSYLRIFGTPFEVRNPGFLYTAILLTAGYLLWRYFQYFVADQAYDCIRGEFKSHMDHSSTIILLKLAAKEVLAVPGFSGKLDYKDLFRDGVSYRLRLHPSNSRDKKGNLDESKAFEVSLAIASVEARRLLAFIYWLFRSRLISDLIAPYVLVVYGVFVFGSARYA
jgi:hypothetical protein